MMLLPFLLAIPGSKRRTVRRVVPSAVPILTIALKALFASSLDANTMASALATQPSEPQRPTSPALVRKRRLVWHRNRDLRFHDHPFYDNDESGGTPTATTSVFVFDDDFGCGVRPSTCLPERWKATHLGPHGMRVLLESVRDLRASSLRRTDREELVVRRGPTIPTLLGVIEEWIDAEWKAPDSVVGNDNEGQAEATAEYVYEVCWNEEPGWHERQLSDAVKVALEERFETLRKRHSTTTTTTTTRRLRLSIHTAMSSTLYHPDDLPSPGEWQPLSKKEKRRRQKQQQRKQQPKKRQPPRNNSQNGSSQQNNDWYVSPSNPANTLVDVSVDRWIGMPRIMGDFRKIGRERAGVRPCRSSVQASTATTITTETTLHKIDTGLMPTLEDLLSPLLDYLGDDTGDEQSNNQQQPILGLPHSVVRDVCHRSLEIHNRNLRGDGDPSMVGGETAALKHLDNFCRHHLFTAQRSLACVDHHQSSRMSHFLAFGCLSPRTIIEVAERAIAERNKQNESEAVAPNNHSKTKEINDGTWLISHMTMRDFFLYTCLASGERFYGLEGIPVNQKAAASMVWRDLEDNHELWTTWATGDTGLPLVDAAMTELLQTGYCSNRVRQNAASVLTKDLKLDWRAGAEWFQFLLVDHCVGANWGNWLYFSGVGPDPKNRHFCTVSQALKYDPHGKYVSKWIPALNHNNNSDDNVNCRHQEHYLRPWDFDESWKRPVVDPESQYTWRDLERLKETGKLMEEKTPTLLAETQKSYL